jgi:hypothetical protein
MFARPTYQDQGQVGRHWKASVDNFATYKTSKSFNDKSYTHRRESHPTAESYSTTRTLFNDGNDCNDFARYISFNGCKFMLGILSNHSGECI